MADLRELKATRGTIKSHFTRTERYLNDHPTASAAIIQSLAPKDATEARAFIEDENKEREAGENRYYIMAATMQDILNREKEALEHRLRAAAAAAAPIHPQGQPFQRVETEYRHKPKLPEIKIPIFGGNYTQWLLFHNSFRSIIHDNPNIPAIQKHHYLIGQLSGEAREIVQNIYITENSYETAWRLLVQTYDNERIIIDTHLEELFNFPSISKEDKSESIKKLVMHIQSHLGALKTFQQPTEHWGTPIIHLAKKQLDYSEQRDWQDHIKDRTHEQMPTLEEFLQFLITRSQTLKMINQNKTKASNPKQTQQSEKKSEKKQEKKSHWQAHHHTSVNSAMTVTLLTSVKSY
ncbi:uncharacterized protein LOC107042475 [Diachasma alloeum]|uniref:uncharacterized protein LOC107042475 n=1 Tax=Diachasma alloeum TaxID=454923 RepID=UPI0007381DAF|nr:uncharacterized protein LOC107042475 [Diachasma alloeum]